MAVILDPNVDGVPEHVILCVKTILTTPVGTVVLDREFGLDPTILDLPLPTAQARLTTEIITKLKKYEPRVKVESITFTSEALDGILRPKVVCSLVDP